MSSSRSPLHDIRVATPCTVSWEKMEGNERVRFCESCALNVYNLSAMTAQEAEHLVVRKEGRLCVRFYQREDGTIMTQDCPRGLIAIRRSARRTALILGGSVAAMFVLLFGLLTAAVGMSHRAQGSKGPFNTLNSWLNGSSGGSNIQGGLQPPNTVMGDVCPVNAPNQQPPQENPPRP
jgi:hypothetical protein